MTKQTKPRASLAFRNKLRESILEIGKRLIEEEGLSSVQARRIAVEAGCAVGSIYNVFEDLDELIIELNRRTLDELEAKLQATHDQPKQATTHGRLLALARA